MFVMDFSVGIRTLKVDGRSNDSPAKHPSLGNCYHLMPAYCYLHRVHQQCGHCNALPTCVSLNGEFSESEMWLMKKTKNRRRDRDRDRDRISAVGDRQLCLAEWFSEVKCYIVYSYFKIFPNWGNIKDFPTWSAALKLLPVGTGLFSLVWLPI